MDEPDIDEIEQSALRLLAGREHSRAELRHKLAARAAAPQLIERVLDRLAACNAQNDRRFIEEYIAARQRWGFGPLRILRELREKGLASDLIGECLDRHDSVWDRALLEAVRRKFGPAGRQRLPGVGQARQVSRVPGLCAGGYPPAAAG